MTTKTQAPMPRHPVTLPEWPGLLPYAQNKGWHRCAKCKTWTHLPAICEDCEEQIQQFAETSKD